MRITHRKHRKFTFDSDGFGQSTFTPRSADDASFEPWAVSGSECVFSRTVLLLKILTEIRSRNLFPNLLENNWWLFFFEYTVTWSYTWGARSLTSQSERVYSVVCVLVTIRCFNDCIIIWKAFKKLIKNNKQTNLINFREKGVNTKEAKMVHGVHHVHYWLTSILRRTS